MRRTRRTAGLLAGVLLLAGCGVQPSGVADGGEPPTGVARGQTLYFVDDRGRLVPQVRDTDRLGTVTETLALLLTGPGPDAGVHTEIAETGVTRVTVSAEPGLVDLRVPLAVHEVSPLGIDQIVCTALAHHVQAGGSPRTEVRIQFTSETAASRERRTCPLIG